MIKHCMITLSVLLFLLFLLSPGTAMSFFDWYRVPKDEQAVNALLERSAKSLVKRHPIRVIGTSVGMPGGDVRILGLRFQILGPLSKEQLRTVIIDCAQVFLSHVNADEKVRPSLNHYPFGIEDIEMVFFVTDPTGRDVDAPHIGTVRFRNGNLTYRILQDDKDGIPVTKGEPTESYEEALEAMKREQEGSDQYRDQVKIITDQNEGGVQQEGIIRDFGDIVLKESTIGQFDDRIGAFANRDFKKGEIVIKWNLKSLSEEEYRKLPEYEKDNFCHQRNGIHWLYPDPECHVNRFSRPNVVPDFEKQANIALMDIKKGEELFIADTTVEDF